MVEKKELGILSYIYFWDTKEFEKWQKEKPRMISQISQAINEVHSTGDNDSVNMNVKMGVFVLYVKEKVELEENK